MMRENELSYSVYLVLIRLSNEGKDIKKRVTGVVPTILAELKKISLDNGQLLFTDTDGACFGYLVNSNLAAHDITNRVQNNTSFAIGDTLAVLEIGTDCTGIGFSVAMNWLSKT